MQYYRYIDIEDYFEKFLKYKVELSEDGHTFAWIPIHHCYICNKETSIDEDFCEDCKNSLPNCDNCGKKIYNSTIKTFKNKKYCEDCFSREFFCCHSCNKIFPIHKAYNFCLNFYCKHCFDLKYFKCKSCGRTYGLNEQNSECNGYCKVCRPENIVLEYRYKPIRYKFKTTRKTDKIFMGVELEISGASNYNILNSVVKQYKNYNDFYFKKDGSIRGIGFEIVSHPYTLLYHQNKALWKQLFETLNTYHINKTDNCGLHVHFPRNIFSNENIAALDCFVNMNTELIPKLSGRDFNGYCANSLKRIENWGKNNSDRKEI